ncbi:MAG: hypothetical protein R6U21_06895 [Thermoplasmatota archaeon]
MIKKIAVVFVILIIGIPLTTAVSSLQISHHQSSIIGNEQSTPLCNDPPDWATHRFRGIVGITNLRGRPLRPIYSSTGYCTDSFSDKFVGVLVERNQTEASGYLAGKVFGSFFLGRLSADQSNEKAMTIVGIGTHNETHFYFRFIGMRGPSLYLAGYYHPLSIKN